MNQKALEEKLQEAFHPFFLKVENESHLHAGHAGVQERGGSHYSLVLVSTLFEGLSRVQRHQQVYKHLETELENKDRSGLHALRMKLYTEEEWSKQLKTVAVNEK